MWYNIDNKIKPSGVTSTPGTANLVRRLTCLLYHKGASVLVARNGNQQPSLSVSQVNPTSYVQGVTPAHSLNSKHAAIDWLRGYVQIAVRGISAGMAKAGSVIRVARRAALLTWNKAKRCALSVSSVGVVFHQTEVT